jgi:hypothetical protein
MLFQETLDEWSMCQRTWMYLETIFSSPDIVRQLPSAAKMFQAVDKSFRSIMRSVNDDPLAIKQVRSPTPQGIHTITHTQRRRRMIPMISRWDTTSPRWHMCALQVEVSRTPAVDCIMSS